MEAVRRVPVLLGENRVQVKYEILRAHVVDGTAIAVTAGPPTATSRAAFHLVAAAFEEAGMAELVGEGSGGGEDRSR